MSGQPCTKLRQYLFNQDLFYLFDERVEDATTDFVCGMSGGGGFGDGDFGFFGVAIFLFVDESLQESLQGLDHPRSGLFGPR